MCVCIYIYIERERERKIDKVIQVEGEIYWGVILVMLSQLNITNITPHGPDYGSVEPKRYSVNFSLNLSFHLDCLVINFSLHIVGLQSIIYFHVYIYIYIYILFYLSILKNIFQVYIRWNYSYTWVNGYLQVSNLFFFVI